MSQIATKAAAALAKPLLPYLRHLPQPLLTLVPVLALHVAGHQEPTSISWFLDPMVNPMHPPILLTMVMIPCIYALGLVTGYISWVDKLWPFYTPLHSLLIVLWTIYNPSGAVYGHNLPRLGLMLLLQVIWSTRLTSHAIRRGFYEMRSQDYRYDVIKAIFPGWAYQLVHLFAVAIAQPLLLLGLSLPLHAVLMLPPMELSPAPIPALFIPYSAFKPFLPAHFHSASGSTPVLNLADLVLFVIGCGFVLIEYKADNAMYAFQQTKHGSKSKDVVQPQLTPQQQASKGPKPTAYPRSHHPGFITSGLFSWVRHPNFMGEQLFWVTQALFVVAAGESSGITKSGWVKGSVFGPCFALSLLFCGSTFITEWITARKYPAYRSYQKVVGQFVPQETMFKRLLGLVTPQRRRDALKELKAKTA